MVLRCARAVPGMLASGLPSSANRVSDGVPVKASTGNSVRRLNPMSNTYKYKFNLNFKYLKKYQLALINNYKVFFINTAPIFDFI